MAWPLRTQMTFPSVDGNPRNITVSTFHWNVADAVSRDDAAFSATAQHIAFWTQDGGGGNVPGKLLSALISRAADVCVVKAYDLEEAEPRHILLESTFTLPGPYDLKSLTRQLCIAVSYTGLLVGIPEGQLGVLGEPRPRARHRGRFFVGPLSSWCDTEVNNEESRPSNAAVFTLTQSAGQLRDQLYAGGFDVQWAVYSRVNNQTYPVVGGWVDNRFDVQRRRASVATVRTDW